MPRGLRHLQSLCASMDIDYNLVRTLPIRLQTSFPQHMHMTTICRLTNILHFRPSLDELENSNISKGPGSDFIPPSVVEYCNDLLAPPLSFIFNRSLCSVVFPNVFKTGHNVQLHKSGLTSGIRNYRPITVLHILAKVFENIVLSRIISWVRNKVDDNQHGFMLGRSTTNLIMF